MTKQREGGGAFPHYRELDGIRGCAALAVFFHHMVYTTYASLPVSPSVAGRLQRALYLVSAQGAAGVDLFFVLSGFLITSLLLKDRTRGSYYHDFYWKRALRILPLYVLCLVGILLAFPHSAGFVLLSALFLSNFASLLHVASFGPFWSLAIEEQFYIVWPTVVRRRSLEQITATALAVCVAVGVLRLGAAFAGHYNYQLTPLRLDGLGAGALLACRQTFRERDRDTLASDWKLLLLLAVAALPLLLWGLSAAPPQGAAFRAASAATGETLLFSAIIGLAIGFAGSRTLAPLRSTPLLFFGAISYAFYMLHAFVMELYDRWAGPPQTASAPFFLRIGIVLAATTALCLATRYLIELPALSLRRFVLHRPARAPEIAEPLITR